MTATTMSHLWRPCGALLLLALACEKKVPAERRFYDEHIQPVFDGFCVGNTSPCHRIDPDSGVALGNLDLTSFEGVQKRPDVLRNYGAYPQPLLLLKALPEESVLIPYQGRLVQSEIGHVGGKTLSPTSEAFFELKRWIDNGATRDGLPASPPDLHLESGCSDIPREAPPVPIDRQNPAYQQFVASTLPLLQTSCAFSNCHNSPQADLYITCGQSDVDKDANFYRVATFVALPPDGAERSELLLRPLSPRSGGSSHTGGVFFQSRDAEGWKTLETFVTLLRDNPLPARTVSPGEAFFGEHVMPVLLRRGCAVETCHSPNGFNDFRLRPGSVGFLSAFALHRNYEGALSEFMSLDTPDVRQSRLVKKNLFARNRGIAHRAGALLEGPGPGSEAPCPTPFDPATSSAFCTLAEWHRIEREDHADRVSAFAEGDRLPVAFVARPPDPDGPLDFDTFRGGADLRLAEGVFSAAGRLITLENPRSGLEGCAGLAGRTDLDVRRPSFSHDGGRLVFSVRQGDAGGHDLWLLDLGAGSCRRLTEDGGRLEGSVRVHDFDPVFAPDGSLVFASTRAGTVTPKRFLPNADLYRTGPTLDFSSVERMTVLSGSELAPWFMQNGQLSFTAEKATPDFYQLSGRRINWDLTDYHPLLAQRAQSDTTFGSVAPSVGYEQATEIREGLDRNFLLVLSRTNTRGAGGTIAVFNRSVGPFEAGRTDVTFLPSMHLLDPSVTADPGTAGLYRSPFSLPDGEVLASYAGNVSQPATEVPRYDLVGFDEVSKTRRVLLEGGALSLVEASVGYKRSTRLLFRNLPQLVFGGESSGSGDAVVHFPDLPVLATLLDANLRRGRNVAAFDGARHLAVYEVTPATSAAAASAAISGPEAVYAGRQLLGSAPLKADGSLKVWLPPMRPLIFELLDQGRNPIFTMREEHQVGPGERIAPGVPRHLFNGVCGGCHGSLSGLEPDVAVTPDALTGATRSLARNAAVEQLR